MVRSDSFVMTTIQVCAPLLRTTEIWPRCFATVFLVHSKRGCSLKHSIQKDTFSNYLKARMFARAMELEVEIHFVKPARTFVRVFLYRI